MCCRRTRLKRPAIGPAGTLTGALAGHANAAVGGARGSGWGCRRDRPRCETRRSCAPIVRSRAGSMWAPARARLVVHQHGVRDAQAAVTGRGQAQAEVDVVAGHDEALVESAHGLELRPLHHHAGGGDRQPVARAAVGAAERASGCLGPARRTDGRRSRAGRAPRRRAARCRRGTRSIGATAPTSGRSASSEQRRQPTRGSTISVSLLRNTSTSASELARRRRC